MNTKARRGAGVWRSFNISVFFPHGLGSAWGFWCEMMTWREKKTVESYLDDATFWDSPWYRSRGERWGFGKLWPKYVCIHMKSLGLLLSFGVWDSFALGILRIDRDTVDESGVYKLIYFSYMYGEKGIFVPVRRQAEILCSWCLFLCLPALYQDSTSVHSGSVHSSPCILEIDRYPTTSNL